MSPQVGSAVHACIQIYMNHVAHVRGVSYMSMSHVAHNVVIRSNSRIDSKRACVFACVCVCVCVCVYVTVCARVCETQDAPLL